MNEFEKLLLEQVKKHPIISNYAITNTPKEDEEEINFAFQEIQRVMKQKIDIEISVEGLKKAWHYISINEKTIKEMNETEISNESTDGSSSESERQPKNADVTRSKKQKRRKQKLMKVPAMNPFAKKKMAIVEELEEEFQDVKTIFESSCEALVKQEVASPLVPLLLEKFIHIEPSKHAQCTNEIIETIILYNNQYIN